MKETDEKLNLDKLRTPEPMLYFDEVILFEDELHDNGQSLLSAKIVTFSSPTDSLSPHDD